MHDVFWALKYFLIGQQLSQLSKLSTISNIFIIFYTTSIVSFFFINHCNSHLSIAWISILNWFQTISISFLAYDNMKWTPGSIWWIGVQTIIHQYGVHWRSGHFITFEITMTIIFEILSGMHLLHSSLCSIPVLTAVSSIKRFDFHTRPVNCHSIDNPPLMKYVRIYSR